jgi:YD repeat-containing protein
VGNLKRLYDPANLRTEYEYDPLHRLTGVIENYTGSGSYSGIPDENIKTSYQYDNEGNLLQVSNLHLPLRRVKPAGPGGERPGPLPPV